MGKGQNSKPPQSQIPLCGTRGRLGGGKKALPAPLPCRRGLRTKSSETRKQNDTGYLYHRPLYCVERYLMKIILHEKPE